jgi:hypothetical protein
MHPKHEEVESSVDDVCYFNSLSQVTYRELAWQYSRAVFLTQAFHPA